MKRELLWDIWRDIGEAPKDTQDCHCESPIEIRETWTYSNGTQHTMVMCATCGGFVDETVFDVRELEFRRNFYAEETGTR